MAHTRAALNLWKLHAHWSVAIGSSVAFGVAGCWDWKGSKQPTNLEELARHVSCWAKESGKDRISEICMNRYTKYEYHYIMDKQDEPRMKGTTTQKDTPCTCVHYWSFSCRKWPRLSRVQWQCLWHFDARFDGQVLLQWCVIGVSQSLLSLFIFNNGSRLTTIWYQYLQPSSCNIRTCAQDVCHHGDNCESNWAALWWKVALCCNTIILHYNPNESYASRE